MLQLILRFDAECSNPGVGETTHAALGEPLLVTLTLSASSYSTHAAGALGKEVGGHFVATIGARLERVESKPSAIEQSALALA